MTTAISSTSLDPLPDDIRNGMIAMGLFGLLSSITTFALMTFITYRMVFWKRYYNTPIHTNQVFILIYNLLLADFQQALSFVISFHWLAQGKLIGPNTQCFAQGWLIQIGDLTSGLWVLAIAVHTFVNLVVKKHIRQRTFIASVVALWIFALFLTVIGPVLSKDDFFVPAGAWCWISDTHESERLYLHYLWIFISQLGSLVIYISIFFYLRGRLSHHPLSNPSLSSSSNNGDPTANKHFKHSASTMTTIISPAHNAFAVSRQRILRTARYMVVYPLAYVALTLPLASARVASMAGRTPPPVFFPIAGSLMASCGVVDVLLYISTRKALVKTSVGIKGSNFSDNSTALRKFTSAGTRRRTDDMGMGMDGLGRVDVDALEKGNGAPIRSGAGSKNGLGDIVVSQTIVLSEDSAESESPRRGDSRSERSDSLRSLVGRGTEPTKSEVQQKSWLA